MSFIFSINLADSLDFLKSAPFLYEMFIMPFFLILIIVSNCLTIGLHRKLYLCSFPLHLGFGYQHLHPQSRNPQFRFHFIFIFPFLLLLFVVSCVENLKIIFIKIIFRSWKIRFQTKDFKTLTYSFFIKTYSIITFFSEQPCYQPD